MRKIYAVLGILAWLCGSAYSQVSTVEFSLPEFQRKNAARYDGEIIQKMNSMSAKELIGQMTQIDLALICKGDICALEQPQTLEAVKLKTAFQNYAVGSVLNVGCGSGTLSREQWISIQKGIQQANKQFNSHQIPVIFGIDAIHGANYTQGATLFPQQIAQAATWNPELVKVAAKITAYDVRASGIHWNFSPVLDLARQPLWSRFFETYGEDVYLARQMTKAAIQGYQNGNREQQVASCMKHFLGYSYPLSGKDRTPAWIDDRTLREYFLPTFQEAIEQGALTTMINSGEINGVAVHSNYDILTNLLRVELGFEGIAVTDWEDIYKLHHTHKVAPDLKEAVYMAIIAGIDMSMTPSDFRFNDLLLELVNEGRIPLARLHESVYRILKVKKALGLWYLNSNSPAGNVQGSNFELSDLDRDYPNLGSPKHSEFAYQTALESITLLKNQQQTLPLKNQQDIFVAGNAANDLTLMNGAWTHTWQGGDTKGYQTPGKPTYLKALKDQWGNRVHTGFPKKNKSKNQILIYCIGEKPATEIPGNIQDLIMEIPATDLLQLQERKKKGLPTVLVLTLARPRIITHIDTLCTAVVHAYLPGDEGARALVTLLSGEISPSGKLPFTYPKSSGDVVHYDRKPTEDNDIQFGKSAYNPLYDFGHGLSYSEFEYTKLEVSLINNKSVSVNVTVKNMGTTTAQEVVQVYYRDEYASITPSVKKLCAFSKIRLEPGTQETLQFSIPLKDLSFVNRILERVTEAGDFTIMVKDLNAPFTLNETLRFN